MAWAMRLSPIGSADSASAGSCIGSLPTSSVASEPGASGSSQAKTSAALTSTSTAGALEDNKANVFSFHSSWHHTHGALGQAPFLAPSPARQLIGTQIEVGGIVLQSIYNS